MSGEDDGDLGFTQAQQDWIHQLNTSQQGNAVPPGNSSQDKTTPLVTSQSQSVGNLGECSAFGQCTHSHLQLSQPPAVHFQLAHHHIVVQTQNCFVTLADDHRNADETA